MNTVFKKTGFGIAILLFMSNCIKELKPLNNGYIARPVVWCILNCDSAMSIITSGNRGINDNDVVNLVNLKMYLLEEGVVVDSLLLQTIHSDTQTHHFKLIPKPNKIYKLKIIGKDIDLSGQVKTPNYINVPKSINLSQGENAQLNYKLTDDVTFNDAYQFKIEVVHYGILIDTATKDTLNKSFRFIKNYEKFDEPSLKFDFLKLNTIENNLHTYPVSDDLFNGKDRSFLFTIQNPISNVFFKIRKTTIGFPVADRFICKKQYVLINCRKISTDYYKYMVSENQNNSIFGTPYFNPTNVYSNIIGGLGLFGAMTERMDTVWIRK